MILFCPRLSGLGQGKQAELIISRTQRDADISLVTFDDLSPKASGPRFVKFIMRIRRLREILRKKNCKQIVAFGESSLIISALTFTGAKITYACRDDRILRMRYDQSLETLFIEMAVRIILFMRLARVLCQSEDLYKNYFFGATKVPYAIPNYINIAKFKEHSKGRKKHIAIIGRYSTQKNQLSIIEHLSELNYQFIFYGSIIPETPKKILDFIKINPSSFVIDKKLSASDYKNFSLVVLPSLWEGIPNVALEAFEAGVPLILSKNVKIASVFDEILKYCCNDRIKEYVKFCHIDKDGLDIAALDEFIKELTALPDRGPFYGTGFNVVEYNAAIDGLWRKLNNV